MTTLSNLICYDNCDRSLFAVLGCLDRMRLCYFLRMYVYDCGVCNHQFRLILLRKELWWVR